MTSSSPTSIIGKRLLMLRKQHDISLRELEAMSGTSASLLSQIENGKTNPSVMTLQNIATALNIPVKYFFEADELEPGLTSESPKKTVETNGHHRHSVSENMVAPTNVPSSFCDSLVHRKTRPTIELEGGVIWERLTDRKEDGIEFLEVIYDVGATSGPALASHHGRECALVLEGELLLEINDEQYILQAGDSMTFDSMTPHRVTNVGQTPLRVFWGNLNS